MEEFIYSVQMMLLVLQKYEFIFVWKITSGENQRAHCPLQSLVSFFIWHLLLSYNEINKHLPSSSVPLYLFSLLGWEKLYVHVC